MPIKIEPFINPFRKTVVEENDNIKVIINNGKTYKKIVRKK